jgi:hypothetical protein
MTKRKHYDLIMAYANGATIEMRGELSGKWDEMAYPSWVECLTYRVKQAPKPDIVHEVLLVNSLSAGPLLYAASPSEANCVLVFDGETNKLKGCSFKAA